MKKILMSSVVLVVFAVAITLFQMSCTKESNATPTTLTKDQILVEKTWKIDQLQRVISGVYSSYIDAGVNTTGVNYGNIRYTFNSNGTGTYIDEVALSHGITWSFTSSDKRTIDFVVNSNHNNWEMVEIAGNYIHVTQHFGSNNLMSYRLIQIP